MHEEERSIKGLIIAGTIALGVGYIYSVSMAAIYFDETWCGAHNGGVMFVPIIGGFIWGAIDSDGCATTSVLGEVMGLPTAIVQTLGLAMLVIGVLVKRTVLVPDAVSLVPRLAPGPGEVGLGLAWDF